MKSRCVHVSVTAVWLDHFQGVPKFIIIFFLHILRDVIYALLFEVELYYGIF